MNFQLSLEAQGSRQSRLYIDPGPGVDVPGEGIAQWVAWQLRS